MGPVAKIDTEGFYVEDVLVGDDQELPAGCVGERPPEGLHTPRWTGSGWTEGKPEAEIVEARKAAKVEVIKAAGVEELAAYLPHGRDELQAVHNAALVAIQEALNLPVDERLRRVDEAQRKAFARRDEVEQAASVEEVEAVEWT